MEAGTFRTSRNFPHSAAAVFRAFADPAILASWWGPEGFTNEFETFEFRAGGVWKFVMIGPDGTRYPNESTFAAIVPNRQVAIRHIVQPHFTLTVEWTKLAEGVRLEWTQTFDDPAVAASIRHIVEPANEQNLDRLSRALAALTP